MGDAASDGECDERRWKAVVAREHGAAPFVYAVTTTGIYCRPGCPSRAPSRAHVRFFVSAAEAEAAGFRACKRCRPQALPAPSALVVALERACRLIDASESLPSLETLAREAGLSRFHFHRSFRAVMGVTPRAYAAARRRARLQQELQTAPTVTDAAYRSGFNSSGPFYAAAADELGMQPSRFRTHGAGATIHFAVGTCSLGAVLVAATERGLCAIDLGDDAGVLVEALQRRFARADFVGGDAAFERLVATVIALVESPDDDAARELPLDVRGTAFQQRVWNALRRIPYGATTNYRAVAELLGAANGARAVAAACAANPLAVIVPCHRVVALDGHPRGYRWGIARKRDLLQRESAKR